MESNEVESAIFQDGGRQLEAAISCCFTAVL